MVNIMEAKNNPVHAAKMAAMRSRYAFRLWNPQTGKYLHMGAKTETPSIDLSWSGFRHQAETLEERAKVRGEKWPYIAVELEPQPVGVPA